MLQLAQQYVMLTQEGIIADVCQGEHQAPEDTKSLNATTGPTCNPHQWAQEQFQLRIVPQSWAEPCRWQLWARALSSAASDLSTRLVRLTSDLTHPLVLVSGWVGYSRASAPSSSSRCPYCGSPTREIVALTVSHDHVLTANDKKFRKFNDQVTPEQHNEYRLFHIASKAKSRDEEVTLKHWLKDYQASTKAANWKIKSSPRPCNQASLAQDDNTDFIPLRGKTCRLDAGGSPAGLIIQQWP